MADDGQKRRDPFRDPSEPPTEQSSDVTRPLIEQLRQEAALNRARVEVHVRAILRQPIAAVVDVPWEAVDAALDIFIHERLEGFSYRRTPRTSGSADHVVLLDRAQYATIRVRALVEQRTHITLHFGAAIETLDENPQRVAKASFILQLWRFINWLAEDQEVDMPTLRAQTISMRQELPAMPHDVERAMQEAMARKRRGPAPAPHNAWARSQARQGATVDDLLDDYMRLRGDDPQDADARRKAREALRKTIERD